MKHLKKLIAVVGGILLLMGMMMGTAFSGVLIQYTTTIREVTASESTTMFFLGSGMIALAGILRKTFFKK